MNIKVITSLTLVLVSSIVFFSCNNDDNEDYTGLTNDAQIYSFSLTSPITQSGDSATIAQDSLRMQIVNVTNYAIDQIAGQIYNPDSLPYLTKLKNVLVKVSFNPTYGISTIQVQTPDSLYYWNTTDSINFSKLPVKFIVKSRGNTTKTYNVDVRTHKVDPDLIVWDKMNSFPTVGESKTLLVDNYFYAFVLENGILQLNKSGQDAIVWSKISVSGLPANVDVESFTYINSSFNVIDKDGNSYTSVDGISWNNVTNNLFVNTIVGVLPSNSQNLLLAIVKNEGDYYFAKGNTLSDLALVNNILGSVDAKIPSNFPVRGSASYSNNTLASSDKLLTVTGGVDRLDTSLTNTWLIKNTSNGLEITSFVQKTPFLGGSGLSAFGYDNLYYLLQNKQFYTSNTLGGSWSEAPEKQNLDPKIQAVNGQTVIVDSAQYIWIFGGVSETGVYLNEVWRGRLNKLVP